MKYWIGSLLGAYGLYLLIAAQGHRSQILAARSEAIRLNRIQAKPIDPHSVAALGEMVAPMVMIALAWLTLKLCFAYYWLNTNGTLSPLDLAGTLVLLVGYATWLNAKTKYRMPDIALQREMDVTRPRPEGTQMRAAQQPSFALELTP